MWLVMVVDPNCSSLLIPSELIFAGEIFGSKFVSGQQSGEEPLLTGARGKAFIEQTWKEAKQGNYLIGYSLSGCLIWENLVGCL